MWVGGVHLAALVDTTLIEEGSSAASTCGGYVMRMSTVTGLRERLAWRSRGVASFGISEDSGNNSHAFTKMIVI